MVRWRNAAGGVLAISMVAMLAGCADSGIDLEVNSPLLEAAVGKITGGKRPEPNLQERAPLVMPPRKDVLPEPGQGQQLAAVNNGRPWPTDPDEAKKQARKVAEAKKDDYCKNGNWNEDKKNIEDFQKNTGQEPRCRPQWIDRILGSSSDSEEKQ